MNDHNLNHDRDREWSARVERWLDLGSPSGPKAGRLQPLRGSTSGGCKAAETRSPPSRDETASELENLELDLLSELEGWVDDGADLPPSERDRELVRAAVRAAQSGPALDIVSASSEASPPSAETPNVPAQLGRYAVAGALLLFGAAGSATSIVSAHDDGRGRGQAEDPSRIMIVAENDRLERWLSQEVFYAAGRASATGPLIRYFKADTVTALEAIVEGQVLNPSAEGLDAIIEWADERGFGYVAVAGTGRDDLDFSGSSSSGNAEIVVFPVGDLADSGYASTASAFPGIEHRRSAGQRVALMRALAVQPELQRIRRSSSAMSRGGDGIDIETSPEELRSRGLNFRSRQWQLPNYAELAAHTIEAWPTLTGIVEIDAEFASSLLTQPLRDESWVPVPTGGTLVASSALSWTSDDGRSAALRRHPTRGIRFSHSLGGSDDARSSCGGLPTHGIVDWRAGMHGDTLTIQRASGARESYALDLEAKGVCNFIFTSRIAAEDMADAQERSAGVGIPLGESTRSGRTASIDALGQLWLRGIDGHYETVAPQFRFHGSPQWLDDRRISAAYRLSTSLDGRTIVPNDGIASLGLLQASGHADEVRIEHAWPLELLTGGESRTVVEQMSSHVPAGRLIIALSRTRTGDRIDLALVSERRRRRIPAGTVLAHATLWQGERTRAHSLTLSQERGQLAFVTYPQNGLGSSQLQVLDLPTLSRTKGRRAVRMGQISQARTVAVARGTVESPRFEFAEDGLTLRSSTFAFGGSQTLAFRLRAERR